MGTRSNIAYKKEDDSIVSSYCHYDGYVEHNGVMLLKHYNGEKQARELVDNGYMSSLGSTTEEINGGRANQDEPQQYRNEYNFINDSDTVFIEFIYLFAEGHWQVSRSMSIPTPDGYSQTQFYHSSFRPLSEVVTLEMMKKDWNEKLAS